MNYTSVKNTDRDLFDLECFSSRGGIPILAVAEESETSAVISLEMIKLLRVY